MSEADIDAAADETELIRMATDHVISRDVRLSASDIAAQLGRDPKRVARLFRALGVVVPDIDAVLFTDEDVVLVEGWEEVDLLDTVDGRALMRVIATMLDRVAEASVALYVQGTEERLAREKADALVTAQKAERMTELAEGLGLSLGPLFRHHLGQAIGRQRVSQAAVTSRDVAWHAVGFVDLVGSTAYAEKIDVSELRVMVSEFEARAFEVAALCGGRVIKFIGDEIMVAALDPRAGCRLMLALVEACSTSGMQPRGGLAWGEVLFRGGDYYGRDVNLASRLVDAAIPGEVLVDASVVEAGAFSAETTPEFLFEPAGRRVLKGFADPVAVWTVTELNG